MDSSFQKWAQKLESGTFELDQAECGKDVAVFTTKDGTRLQMHYRSDGVKLQFKLEPRISSANLSTRNRAFLSKVNELYMGEYQNGNEDPQTYFDIMQEHYAIEVNGDDGWDGASEMTGQSDQQEASNDLPGSQAETRVEGGEAKVDQVIENVSEVETLPDQIVNLKLSKVVSACSDELQQKLQKLGLFNELAFYDEESKDEESKEKPQPMPIDVVKSVEYGFVCINFDLKVLGVEPSFAEFIELDPAKALRLELHFNMEKLLESELSDQELEQLTFSQLCKEKQYVVMLWSQADQPGGRSYVSLCEAAVKNFYQQFSARQGSELSKALRYVSRVLKFLNCHCYLCLKPHRKAYSQMLECSECKDDYFSKQKMPKGDIFAEIKRDPEVALFLVYTTYSAFKSRDSSQRLPYPEILMKSLSSHVMSRSLSEGTSSNQMEELEPVESLGVRQESTPPTLQMSPNLQIAIGLLEVIYSVIKRITHIQTGSAFRDKLNEVTNVHAFSNEQLQAVQKGSMQAQDKDKSELYHDWAYRLLRFLFMTRRQILMNMTPKVVSEEMKQVLIQHIAASGDDKKSFEQIIAVIDRDHAADQAFEKAKSDKGSVYAFQQVSLSELYGLIRGEPIGSDEKEDLTRMIKRRFERRKTEKVRENPKGIITMGESWKNQTVKALNQGQRNLKNLDEKSTVTLVYEVIDREEHDREQTGKLTGIEAGDKRICYYLINRTLRGPGDYKEYLWASSLEFNGSVASEFGLNMPAILLANRTIRKIQENEAAQKAKNF